ncbi:MAG: MBL fold metallo-hydrolase [Phycisphaeraceae bacterium]|nr:MBL fold metallo-hydrolase [Phycisphaeraceae bacterium]
MPPPDRTSISSRVISDVRFTFLGTGTSAGIPAIGCDCAVCTSQDPRDRRLRTSSLLEFTDAKGQARAVLIDAGPDLREQALRHGMKRLDAILFTHNHVDHTWGLDEVRRFNAIQDGPIDVYADAHTDAHLRRVYTHIFDRDRNVNDSFVATLIGHRVEPGRAFTVHGLRVMPIPLLHGKLPVLGYRLEAEGGDEDERDSTRRAAESRGGRRSPRSATEAHGEELGIGADAEEVGARARNASEAVGNDGKGDAVGSGSGSSGGPLPLAYCTDVSAVPPESWVMLKGLETLVLDALRDRRHPTHLTLDQALSIAERVDARRTYFVHMSHDLGHAETMARLEASGHAARAALAHDGLTLKASGNRGAGK